MDHQKSPGKRRMGKKTWRISSVSTPPKTVHAAIRKIDSIAPFVQKSPLGDQGTRSNGKDVSFRTSLVDSRILKDNMDEKRDLRLL